MSYGVLHTHTSYSLLDGADMPTRKAWYAAKNGIKHVAMTEHGGIYGWLDHVKACEEYGVHPVLGIETYHMPDFAKAPNKDQQKEMSLQEIEDANYAAQYYHLTLLAMNNTGYRNLCKMLTIASRDYFYKHANFTDELLAEYADGVICLSGCVSGYIAQHILAGDIDSAYAKMEFFKHIYGDRFYLEVMPHDFDNQRTVNRRLEVWSDVHGIPIVMTDDSHYVHKELYDSYQVLRAMRNYPESTVDYSQLYLHTEDEMVDAWVNNGHGDRGWAQKYLDESGRIAERCNVTFDYQLEMPTLPGLESEEDQYQELKRRCLLGILEKHKYTLSNGKKRILPEYEKRLKYELETLREKQFCGYMLLSASLPQHALEMGYEIQGRGSVCGSLVAWLLGNHRVDPIRYDLSFDRFCGPNRKKLPDVDNDIPDTHRGELIEWLHSEYENVVQIATFGTYKTKSIVGYLKKVLVMENGDGQRFSDVLRDYSNGDESAPKKKVLLQNSELRRLEEKYKAVTHYCWLWGQISSIGTHPGGVAIMNSDITDRLAIVKSHETWTTSCDMEHVEDMLGILKLDALGVAALTVTLEAEEHAGVKYTDVLLTPEERKEKPYLYDDTDMEAPEIWQAFADLDLLGIMQMETEMPFKYVRELPPQSIDDVARLSGLNRPFTIKHKTIKKVIAWKQGKAKKPVVYQDDVLELCAIAGLDYDQTDKILKAIKGKAVDVSSLQQLFVAGLVQNADYTEKEANEHWEDMKGYGFARGHAMAYAHLACRQMYLKVHYPFSFYLALLRNAKKEERKPYEADAARHGIPLLVPHINGGANYEEVVIGNTHFIQQGMCVVDGVGMGRAQPIVDERLANGEYTSREEFAGVKNEKGRVVEQGRVPGRVATCAVVEALDNCGALCFDARAYLSRSREFTIARRSQPLTPMGAQEKFFRKRV